MKQLHELKYLKSLLVFTVFSNVVNQYAAYDITEPFDLTLILRLKKGQSGYEYPGDLAGEARGEPRELPARLDVGSNSQTYWYGKYQVPPCCRRWEADGWIELDDEQATSTRPLLDNNYRRDGRSLAGVWALQREEGTITSPKLPSRFSTPRTDNVTEVVCLKVLAKVPEGARISLIAENTDKSGAMEIGEIIGTSEYQWTLTKLEKVRKPIIEGHVVRIKVLGKQPKDSINKALIQWTTFCADEVELLDRYDAPFIRKGSTQTHYSLLIPRGKLGTVQSPACLNGGSLDLDLGLCQCAPGFAGAVCETSCGPNKYGVHCTGSCSGQSSDRQCFGYLMCSNRGCKCFAGLQGDTCDQPCAAGYYGSDCDLKCGVCAEEEVCDRYSGKCQNECEGGQQPPFCQEECGLPADKSGSPKDTKQYFWNVGIYERRKKVYTRVCSASLVRPRYLLTAAWCFFSEENLSLKPASRFVALFGTDRQHCFTDDTFPTDVESRDILSISVPPLYRGSKRLHADDIALVQLERAVASAPAIAPLCYEPTVTKISELQDGETGFVAGWNLLGQNCDSSRRWKGYNVEYISHSNCLSQITDVVLSFTDTEKFCAKVLDEENENLVNAAEAGDVGSGFVYDKYDIWYIKGVKSGALAKVNDSNIAVYTKVASYMEWITSTWNRLDIKQAVKQNI